MYNKNRIKVLFEVDNCAIYTPVWSKEMQDLAHLPNNKNIRSYGNIALFLFKIKNLNILTNIICLYIMRYTSFLKLKSNLKEDN